MISLNEWDRLHRMSIRLKAQYPKGTVVELHNMEGESRMPAGLRGRVIAVDDAAQIHVDWDNGSSLALNVDHDSFTVISKPQKKRDDPSR